MASPATTPQLASVTDSWRPQAIDDVRRVKVAAGAAQMAAGQVTNLTGNVVFVNRGAEALVPTLAAHEFSVGPYGTLTFPLEANGLVLALGGGVLAPGVAGLPALVDTVLSDDPARLGGSAGAVTVEGSIISEVQGDVNLAAGQTVFIETDAGVTIQTAPRQTTLGVALVPGSGAATRGPYALPPEAASLLFEWPGATPLRLRVIGNTTQVRYFVGVLDGMSFVSVPVDAARDPSISVFVEQVVASLDTNLHISASTAPAALSAPLITPYSQLAAIQYGVKNLPVVDVSGKRFFTAAIATGGPVTLIPATPNTAWSLYSFMAQPVNAVAGAVLSVGGLITCSATTGGPVYFDFRGAVQVATGAALTMTEVFAFANWFVHLTAAPITT